MGAKSRRPSRAEPAQTAAVVSGLCRTVDQLTKRVRALEHAAEEQRQIRFAVYQRRRAQEFLKLADDQVWNLIRAAVAPMMQGSTRTQNSAT